MAASDAAPDAHRATIVAEHLGKTFPAAGAVERVLTLGRATRVGVTALHDVSLRVADGEIVGLLGPNGSGKTTLLRILAGLLAPDQGQVRVLGLDPCDERSDVRGRIGLVMRDDRAFHHRLTGRENLRLFARLQRIPRREREQTIERALVEAEIADRADRPYRTYSAGMRQRLGFARALVGDPAVLLLDEATSGLDPGLRASFAENLARRAAAGIATVYATHDMAEARELCHRLVLLDQGRTVAAGSWDQVRAAAERVFGVDL